MSNHRNDKELCELNKKLREEHEQEVQRRMIELTAEDEGDSVLWDLADAAFRKSRAYEYGVRRMYRDFKKIAEVAIRRDVPPFV